MSVHCLIAIAVLAATTYNSNALDVIPLSGTHITYKEADGGYYEIWNDKGSGGDFHVSIWGVNIPDEYCSLGDVAIGGLPYQAPSPKPIVVKSVVPGALVHPTSFLRVWYDQGSGADWNGAVYKMIPPDGYTCLGGVAMGDWNTQPDTNRYCCVKNEFTTTKGKSVSIYSDQGSGAKHDLSLWTVENTRTGKGVEAENFYPVAGYSRPTYVHLLKKDNDKVKKCLWVCHDYCIQY